jgi:hypothetical protein
MKAKLRAGASGGAGAGRLFLATRRACGVCGPALFQVDFFVLAALIAPAGDGRLGEADEVRDRAMIERLWNPAYKAWFPAGLDDPDLALIKVSAEKAEYWDGQTGAVAHLVGLAQAAVTGRSYQGGENEKIDLK